jgi:hypothetical protein
MIKEAITVMLLVITFTLLIIMFTLVDISNSLNAIKVYNEDDNSQMFLGSINYSLQTIVESIADKSEIEAQTEEE